MSLSERLGPSEQAHLLLSPGQQEAKQRVLGKLRDGTYATEEVACPCGGGQGDALIAERDRYGLPVRTLLCQHCGLLRTSPRMTAEATKRFYQDDYRDLYTNPGHAEGLFEQQRTRGRALVSNLAGLLGGIHSVYEIGCGAGGILAAFAEAGKMVAGADLGDEYLDSGRKHGLDLVHGDAARLVQHRGGPADLVLLLHVLEHFLDLEGELRLVAQAVRPGGFLYIEVPGLQTITNGYGGDILKYLQNAHTYHFNAMSLRRTLESAGLEVRLSTQGGMALCRRPLEGEALPPRTPVDPREAEQVMEFLVAVEQAFAQRSAA